MKTVDLRSDTVTLPSEEMMEAIQNVKLGDDVMREDPTIIELEELAAKKLGKEAGLFVRICCSDWWITTTNTQR
ncbi:MAG: beta-eliminating lyase-related protein [Candidatus Heimdallarchaeota archaeon]